ncbi:cupredoxin domain-containing protein [Patescibacteria group bacterium]|nr:cupredoxin domain-containing protein [Patescibacteria group bacterium]
MRQKSFLLGMVVVALFLGGIIYSSQNTKSSTESPAMTQSTTTTAIENPEQMKENVKTFDVSAIPFSFSLKEIKVKKGDVVIINFTSQQGFHDWVLDEFSAKTNQLQTGETETIEFTADKVGSFEYYCSVGNHGEMGMVGNLIVEE